MQRSWLALAAILGLCGVAAGAVGAHAVQDPFRAGLIVTGTGFALPHAAALIALAAIAERVESRAPGRLLIVAAGWLIAVGTILFGFALWIHGLSGRSLGPVAPTGGTILMLGWLVLLLGVLRARPARS